MKRFNRVTILVAALVILSTLVIYTPTVSAVQPTVILDGKRLTFDVPPTVQNGRTLVPMRGIFEALGATISWKDETKTVSVFKGNTVMAVQIGNPIANVNESPVQLDTPAQIINGRTMVPLRFVSEALGCQVGWDSETSTITISSNGAPVNNGNTNNSKNNSTSNNDASILIGAWSDINSYGEMIDPYTGFSQGTSTIIDWYYFNADGTCRHVMYGNTTITKGVAETDSNYEVRGNQIIFTNRRESFKPLPGSKNLPEDNIPVDDETVTWEYSPQYDSITLYGCLAYRRVQS